MFEPEVPEVLTCGCTLTLRRSETVELVFLTPCTEDHQRTAQRLRGVRSNFVIKGVDEPSSSRVFEEVATEDHRRRMLLNGDGTIVQGNVERACFHCRRYGHPDHLCPTL